MYNSIVFGCNILYDMNFKDTTNYISSNDRLADCVLNWTKYSTVFYAKGSESYKSSYKIIISG